MPVVFCHQSDLRPDTYVGIWVVAYEVVFAIACWPHHLKSDTQSMPHKEHLNLLKEKYNTKYSVDYFSYQMCIF